MTSMSSDSGHVDLMMLGGLSVRPHPLDNQYEYLRVLVYYYSGQEEPSSPPQQYVTIVALDRPRKRNAVHSEMWKEIGSVFSRLGRSGDGCRAVLLVGNGAAFCAGIDITDPTFLPNNNTGTASSSSADETIRMDVARTGLTFRPKLQQMQACFTAVEECPVPVVAAIHGKCIGAGVDLVCCADVRLCTTDAVFAVREVALGLAADVGTLQRLPKIVGNQSAVRELCLTGRDFSASQAADIGLVSRVVAGSSRERVVQEGMRVCAMMVQHSPVAVQGTKHALLYARDHSVADGLKQIADYNALALLGDDLAQAWSALAAKEKTVFPNIPPHSKL